MRVYVSVRVIVLQIVKQTVKEERQDKNYSDKVQAHYDKIRARRAKRPLKT